MLYTVLKSLLLPPGGLILLLAWAFFLVRGVLGRMILFVALAALTLMSLPVVATKLMEGLETYPAIAAARPPPGDAEAILILGAGRYTWAPEYGSDTIDQRALMRLRYGAYLHRATGLPVYVTAGSRAGEDPPLGQLMAKALKDDYGIEVAGVEDQSQTTWENAERSAPMLRADGIGKVLLVTSAWHMPRAMDAFQRFRVPAVAAPTGFVSGQPPGGPDRLSDLLPAMSALSNSYYAIHEYLGRAWYQVQETAAVAEPAPAPGG
jgi:uncharacterized SAM-binding protein YcdF (DUF218 family)